MNVIIIKSFHHFILFSHHLIWSRCHVDNVLYFHVMFIFVSRVSTRRKSQSTRFNFSNVLFRSEWSMNEIFQIAYRNSWKSTQTWKSRASIFEFVAWIRRVTQHIKFDWSNESRRNENEWNVLCLLINMKWKRMKYVVSIVYRNQYKCRKIEYEMKMKWIMLFSLILESRLKKIKNDLSRRDLSKYVDSFYDVWWEYFRNIHFCLVFAETVFSFLICLSCCFQRFIDLYSCNIAIDMMLKSRCQKSRRRFSLCVVYHFLIFIYFFKIFSHCVCRFIQI